MRLYWQRQMQPLTIGAVGLNFPQPMSLSLSHHLEFPCGALGGGFVTPFFIKFSLSRHQLITKRIWLDQHFRRQIEVFYQAANHL